VARTSPTTTSLTGWQLKKSPNFVRPSGLPLNNMAEVSEPPQPSDALEGLVQQIDMQLAHREPSTIAGDCGGLTDVFYERFQAEDDPPRSIEFLNLAIKYGRQAIEKSMPGDVNLALRLDKLSNLLQCKYEALGDEQNDGILEEAVDLGRRAACITPTTEGEKDDQADYCGNLSDALLKLYRKTGDLELLEAAEHFAETASQWQGGANRPKHLNTLANVLFETHLGNPSSTALTRALDAIRNAITLESDRAVFWYTLSVIKTVQYKDRLQDELLKSAIESGKRAMELADLVPATEQVPKSVRVVIINHMSSLLADLYKRYGHLADLRGAVKLGRSVFAELKHDVAGFLRGSQVLPNILTQLYEREGQVKYLEEAINISEEVLSHPSFRTAIVDQAMHYNNLALRTLAWYQHTNKPAAIKAAITYATKAVDHAKDPTERARFSVSLAGTYSARSEVQGSLDDINEAIHILTAALKDLPADDKLRALDFLSSALSQEFRRREDEGGEAQNLLHSSVSYRQAVLDQLPSNHPMLPDVLLRSGYLHGILYSNSAGADDKSLCEGINRVKKAIESLPTDHPALGNAHQQLAALNGVIYEHTAKRETLESAFKHIEVAKKLISEQNPYFAATMNTFAALLVYQWAANGGEEEGYLNRAVAKSLEALRSSHSLPTERIRSGKVAGEICAALCRWDEAAAIFHETLSLATSLAPRQLGRQDQQFYLRALSKLSATAASVSLEAGRSAADALALFEAGRGIMSRISLDLQTNLRRLETANQDLFYKYADAQHRLRSLESTATALVAVGDTPTLRQPPVSTSRIEIVEELEGLEALIRQTIPGLNDFAMPETPGSLPEVNVSSASHAIVVFNVSTTRADAFLMTKDSPVRSLPLQGLDLSVAKEAAKCFVGFQRLTTGPGSTFHERNTTLRNHLEWVWEKAVKPVLMALRFITVGPKQADPCLLPRVTWVTSGPLGLLPLHASGLCWDVGSPENAMFHIISSYVPSLRALQSSQGKSRELSPSSFGRTLVLTMPTTTGYVDLDLGEVEVVQASVAETGAAEVVFCQYPSRAYILEHLDQASTVFFGCHGESNYIDPSNSALVLADAGNGQPERLTISDVATLLLRPAFLAYLSACSTAENTSWQLQDEAIHLASTLLSVGFPHVVASLWEADDQAAGQVARHFFSGIAEQLRLAHSGKSKPDIDIPLALHQAVVLLRNGTAGGGRRKKNANKNVSLWAPFVHLGCTMLC